MSNFIDTGITFVENSDILHEHKDKSFLTPKENSNISQDQNCLSKDGVYKVNIFPGLESSFSKNQILNSSFFLKDETIEKNLTPYNDSENSLGNKIYTLMNPTKRSITYGQDNASDFFVEMKNLPFEDVGNSENLDGYFFDANKITYPKYFSDYEVDKLFGGISVTGITESLTGQVLTGISTTGIKGNIISNSNDARGRQVNVVNKLNKAITNNQVEAFLDSLNDQNVANELSQVVANYSFDNQLINNRNVVVFNDDQNSSSTVNLETSSEFYRLDDNSNVIPFDDRNTVNILSQNDLNLLNNEYNDNENHNATGTSNNNENGGQPESVAFLGDIN
mgnify:CR=1 FL=1